MKRFASRFACLLVFVIGLCAAGCPRPHTLYTPSLAVITWSDADWQHVLDTVVTPDGYVRWDQVKNDTNGVREALAKYLAQAAVLSPEIRPDLFQVQADETAYWINVYNATAMRAVIEAGYPPIAPSTASGTFGGVKLTLDALERTKLAPANDPRIHFALNWCARGCPGLRSEAYAGVSLDKQLMEQGHHFLTDPRGVECTGRHARLSAIIGTFYPADFLAAAQAKEGKPVDLLTAVKAYAPGKAPVSHATAFSVMDFDNRLNAAETPATTRASTTEPATTRRATTQRVRRRHAATARASTEP